MRYLEHPVHPALRASVEAVWSLRPVPGTSHRILPDGCVDLVLVPGTEPLLAGPATAAVLAGPVPEGTVTGVRFRPGHAAGMLGVAAHELRDRTVPVSDVLGAAASRRMELAGPEAMLLERLAGSRPADPLVTAAVAMLQRAPAASVGEVARAVALSERHLRRRFEDSVGYGPKRLARVLRLQRVLELARRRPEIRIGALAYAGGYADQAHMAHDFQALSGRTPRELIGERGRFLQDAAAPIGETA